MLQDLLKYTNKILYKFTNFNINLPINTLNFIFNERQNETNLRARQVGEFHLCHMSAMIDSSEVVGERITPRVRDS